MIRIIQSDLISCHGNLITRFLTTLLKLNVNRFIRTLCHIKRNTFQLLLFIISSQNHFPNSFTLIYLHSSQLIRESFLIHIKKGIRIDLLQLFLSRIADIHFIISHHVTPLCFPVKPSGCLGGLQHKLLAFQLDDTILTSFQMTVIDSLQGKISPYTTCLLKCFGCLLQNNFSLRLLLLSNHRQ